MFVAYSLAGLNIIQGIVINVGLAATLYYVYSQILTGHFLVSDFVVMNMYII